MEDDPPDEKVFRDLEWIAYNGGWIHSNNVLFYFAQSPFFDRQSNNSAVFSQSFNNPSLAHWLNTRELFESRLRERPGIEYVVAHDPLASKVFVQGPEGEEQSKVWVIKKQSRQKQPGSVDEVSVHAFYYIMNDAIFQAPSVAKVLTNRLLTTVTSLTNMLSAAAPLPEFAPSYGHVYFPPVQKRDSTTQTGPSRQSKDNSPMPDLVDERGHKKSTTAADHTGSSARDVRSLIEAMNMSARYRNEYIDDMPLLGEPGNFRFTKIKENRAPPTSRPESAAGQTTPAVSKSPMPEQAPTPLQIQTDVPSVPSKKSAKSTDKSPATPGSGLKPKRRKSKVAATSSTAG